jgi:hypothetical protein
MGTAELRCATPERQLMVQVRGPASMACCATASITLAQTTVDVSDGVAAIAFGASGMGQSCCPAARCRGVRGVTGGRA